MTHTEGTQTKGTAASRDNKAGLASTPRAHGAGLASTPRARSLVAVLATAVVVAAVAACSPEPESSPSASNAANCVPGQLPTTTSGKLTFATDEPVYEPWFVDNDPANGKGFEGAVAAALGKELGYTGSAVTWQRVTFNEAIAPGKKKFDIDINEFSITPERRKAVDQSIGYYDVQQVVVGLKGTKAVDVTDLAGLKNIRLGAQVGTSSLTAAEKAVGNNVRVFNTNDEAIQALKNRQIDGLVVDLPTGFYITSAQLTEPDATGQIIGQIPSASGEPVEQFGVVLDLGSPLTPCVDAAIATLVQDGTLKRLEQQWLAGAGQVRTLQ